jgi:hypothetical protein
LDSKHLEANSEGLALNVAVEEISQAGCSHTRELRANLSEHVSAALTGFVLNILGSLGNTLGQFRVGKETHNV